MKSTFLIFICILLNANLLAQAPANSLHFDGIDDYVNMNSLSDTLAGSQNFTFEFWMKGDLNNQTSSIRTSLFSVNTPTGGNRLLIILGGNSTQTGNLMIYDQGSWGTQSDFMSTQVIGDNTCRHIAYSRDGSLGSIYIDGVLVGTHNADFALIAADNYSLGQEWDIGSGTNLTSSQFYNGFMRDIRVWGDTRTASEISQNMNVTLTGTEPDLIGLYYASDGFTGVNNAGQTTLNDTTGNELDGVLNDFGLTGCQSNWANIGCGVFANSDTVFTCLESDTALVLTDTSITYTYNWTYQGNPVGSSYFVVINNASLNDTGDYYCNITAGGCPYTTHHFYLGVHSLPNFSLGNDTTLCPNSSLLLDLNGSGAANYLWSDMTTNPTYTANSAGDVWVTVEDVNNCEFTDTISISYSPPLTVDLGPDTLLCFGESLQIDGTTLGAANYLWNDMSSNPVLIVNTAGNYSVIASDNFCSYSDTIVVNFTNQINLSLGNDTTLCLNNSLLLDATSPGIVDYQWSDLSINPTLLVGSSSSPWVTVTDAFNCEASDTIHIIYSTLTDIDLGNDTLICSGLPFIIDGTSPGNPSYLWSDLSTSSTLSIQSSGLYWLTVTDNNCSYSDSINVQFITPIADSFSNDTLLCPGETLTLNLSGAGVNPLWQDGSSLNQFFVNQSGIYWVEQSNACQTIRDSITVGYFNPITYAINLENACPGEPVYFNIIGTNGNENFSSVTWNCGDGAIKNETSFVYSYSASGNYSVDLTIIDSNGCTTNATDMIEIYSKPDASFTTSSTLLTTEEAVQFINESSNSIDWEWNFGDGFSSYEYEPSHLYGSPSNYTVSLIASNDYCKDTAYLFLLVNTEQIFYVPNAFTPNFKNPVFIPIFYSGLDHSRYHFSIFNRWGELIFESYDPLIGWDGTYLNKALDNSNVFIWTLEFGEFATDQIFEYTGHAVLLK